MAITDNLYKGYYRGYYRDWCTPIAEAYFNMTVDQETVIIGEWKKKRIPCFS